MRKITVLAILLLIVLGQVFAQTKQTDYLTFTLSDKVTKEKVNYKNKYGISICSRFVLIRKY